MSDYPTMTVIADSKKVRLNKPAPPKKRTRAAVRKAIAASKLKFDISWDELREITREP